MNSAIGMGNCATSDNLGLGLSASEASAMNGIDILIRHCFPSIVQVRVARTKKTRLTLVASEKKHTKTMGY